MSNAYRCNACGNRFDGESPMSLEAVFTDDFAVKLDKLHKKGQAPVNGDKQEADYCEKCALEVLKAIGKRWAK